MALASFGNTLAARTEADIDVTVVVTFLRDAWPWSTWKVSAVIGGQRRATTLRAHLHRHVYVCTNFTGTKKL